MVNPAAILAKVVMLQCTVDPTTVTHQDQATINRARDSTDHTQEAGPLLQEVIPTRHHNNNQDHRLDHTGHHLKAGRHLLLLTGLMGQV
jgi:hypothetical protein